MRQTMTHDAALAVRVLDNLATAVLLFDKALRLLSINSAGEGLLSVSHKQIAGMTPRQIWPEAAFFYKTVQRALESGSTCVERGLDMRLSPGRGIKVDCMITPILTGETAEEILVELVDADSFARVMREVNQKTVQEAGREAVKGMAHEIKNPLGGIRGAAQLLEKELTDAGLSEYTRIIISEADRLRNFIDRMLTASVLPEKKAINIHEALEYVRSVLTAENAAAINIKRDYDPSLPPVAADREQIIQALLNLLRNAAQAIAADGQITLRTRVQRQVTIQHRLNRHVIVVDIIDDGPGIPAEIGAGAFYPMITGRAEGTGLGLSIAQQLIQAHGGLISYERRNEQTCFTLLLPVGKPNE